MIDHHANDFTVWESGAILLYITDVYDKQGLYYGKTAQERAISAQWLTYQLSGLGPVQGSLTFAHRFWEMSYGEKPSDMVIKRFEDESHRLYKVLDGQLAKQKWIALDRPGIADFAFFVWVRIAYAGNLDISSYTHVVKWRDALEADKDVIEALAKYPKLQ
jgi:glutathione S-transferase